MEKSLEKVKHVTRNFSFYELCGEDLKIILYMAYNAGFEMLFK